jgi:NAD(P)-dependent dehydrogenase (short-subunit alcohol dehydrogenase family)
LDDFWNLDERQYRNLLETNLLGALYGCKVAMLGMIEQGYGKIYNMEGMGSDGKVRVQGLLPYGLTKAGMAYLTKALAIEAQGTGILVGGIRPGMVYTGMLEDQYRNRPEEWEKAKKAVAFITDRVDVVAPWIARKVLDNHSNGELIRWNTPLRMLKKLIRQPFLKADPFS